MDWSPPSLNDSEAFRLWRKNKKPSIPTLKFGAQPLRVQCQLEQIRQFWKDCRL
jgi:hypothetical protein